MKYSYTPPLIRIILISTGTGYMQAIIGSAGAQGHAGVINGIVDDTDYDYSL